MNDLFERPIKGYDLIKEQELASKLEITFFTTEEWVNSKLAEGLNGSEIIELFYKTSIPKSVEAYLNNCLNEINSYTINTDEITLSLKEFIESFNKHRLNDLFKEIAFDFPKSFSVGTIADKTIIVPLGQAYRKSIISKGSVNNNDLNYFTHTIAAHELGHLVGSLVNQSMHDQFAEKLAELYTRFKSWDYSLMKNSYINDMKRGELSNKIFSNDTAVLLRGLAFNANNFKLLTQFFFARHYVYNFDNRQGKRTNWMKSYADILTDSEMQEHLDKIN